MRSSATSIRRCLLPALLLMLMLAGCSTAPSHRASDYPQEQDLDAHTTLANDVLIRAMGLVGTPYRWGGNTPEGGFDCSGLVDYVFMRGAKLQLPHNSGQMATMSGQRLDRQDQLRGGDLVFFGDGKGIQHVGVYIGQGRFVHAPNNGGTVRLDDLSGPYWNARFVFGKRLLDRLPTEPPRR